MSTEERIELVSRWLSENTKFFATPTEIVLSDFEIDKVRYSGRFSVSLDGVTIKRRFAFGLDHNGKPRVYTPTFHSPLGAPASYPAVVLTEETLSKIAELLGSTLPIMKAIGLDKETGEWVLNTTHDVPERIIDRQVYDQKMAVASERGFRAVIRTSTADEKGAM